MKLKLKLTQTHVNDNLETMQRKREDFRYGVGAVQRKLKDSTKEKDTSYLKK